MKLALESRPRWTPSPRQLVQPEPVTVVGQWNQQREAPNVVHVRPLSAAERPAFIEPLTQREREVVALLCTGATNRDMARRLVVSERTVESHLSNVYSKIGVRGRTEAMVWALRDGNDCEEPQAPNYCFCRWPHRTMFTESVSGYIRLIGFQPVGKKAAKKAARASGKGGLRAVSCYLKRFVLSVIPRMRFSGYRTSVEIN